MTNEINERSYISLPLRPIRKRNVSMRRRQINGFVVASQEGALSGKS